ncbi:MAG: hypothetical protein ACI3Y5_06775 [Prevotella sp.]
MKKIYMFIAIMLLSVCTAAMAQENEAGSRTISWSVTASYYSEVLKKDFPCTLVAYTDGTYAIKGVYGSEDDIEFKIDSEHMVECENASKEKYYVPEIAFTNYYNAQGTYYYFGAGEYTVCAYYAQGTGYSAWEGDTAEPCLWFYTYLYQGDTYIGGGYDKVSWNKSDIKKQEAWTVTASYYSGALKKDFPCTIVAYNDGTYAIKGVYGSADDIEFVIDREHMVECENASKEKYYVPEIAFTNYYKAQDTYYYFYAGEYTVCAYYAQGAGYSAWEGDTAEPCLWFYTYLYKGEEYIGGGYDSVSWNKSDVSSISTAITDRTLSGRMFSVTGIPYSNGKKMPAGIYIRNGKKFIVR